MKEPTTPVSLTKRELDLLLPIVEHTRDIAERGHVTESALIASTVVCKLSMAREELLVRIISGRVDNQPQP